MTTQVDHALSTARTVDANVADSAKWSAGLKALKQEFATLSPDEKKDFLARAKKENNGAAQIAAKDNGGNDQLLGALGGVNASGVNATAGNLCRVNPAGPISSIPR